MIAAAIRHAVALLTHGTTGVNALLPSVPRPVGEAAPPAVRVFGEIAHGFTALAAVDPALLADGPVLLVSLAAPVAVDVTRGRAEAVHLAIRYAAAFTDGDTFARQAWTTLRVAARACVAPFSTTDTAGQWAAPRDRVAIGAPTGVQFTPPPPDAASEVYVPALVVTFPASDPWLLGA